MLPRFTVEAQEHHGARYASFSICLRANEAAPATSGRRHRVYTSVPYVLLFALMAGQAAPVQPLESAQLTRIRKALAETPPLIDRSTSTDAEGRPVFRLEVRRKPGPPPWENPFPVPSYIRPSMPLYHSEFLQQVTPEEFRASVLYPGSPRTPYGGVGVGIPVGTVFQQIAQGLREESRRRREAHAKDEVRRAIEEWKRGNAR